MRFAFAMAAYDLIRLPRLLARLPPEGRPSTVSAANREQDANPDTTSTAC
jgi:hypothetical protein